MPRRDYVLHHRRATGQPYHPRHACPDERRRQKEAVSVLAADVLPTPDVIAAWLVGQGHSEGYARMASAQVRARAERGCKMSLAVLRQLEDEAAP